MNLYITRAGHAHGGHIYIKTENFLLDEKYIALHGETGKYVQVTVKTRAWHGS